jgi:hypothetical protein
VNDARKKSPRAPLIALDKAIEGAIKVYEKEHRHAAPTEAVAQHLGYKNANNGTALRTIASIRYFGLFERPSDGKLAVTKEVESYQFAPSDELRRTLLQRWLKTPAIYAELLEKYPDALPSDKTLRFDLIQRGFLPDAVDAAVAVFRSSVDFARYYSPLPTIEVPAESVSVDAPSSHPESAAPLEAPEPAQVEAASSDRIPIRLPGGRRAFIEIPMPFFAADKERIKKQIDLLLTQEDEASMNPSGQ